MYYDSNEARQTLVFDPAIQVPGKKFYLVIHRGDGNSDTVYIDGASSMPEARNIAIGMGYAPSHHRMAESFIEFAY